jgi:hypothetical protein
MAMISATYDFEHFADSVKGEDYFDIIYLAEQEAIEAWRVCRKGSLSDGKSASYQSKLKGLIHFMRYGVKPSNLNNRDVKLFNLIYETAELKNRI